MEGLDPLLNAGDEAAMIIRLAEGPLSTKFGIFTEHLFYDGQRESIALVMGEIAGSESVLCRIHSGCISAHVFNSVECDCREQMEMAQFFIEQSGSGVIIWLDQEGRGNGHLALLSSAMMRHAGRSQSEAYRTLGYEEDARSYRIAAQILHDLNVRSIILLTNSPHKTQSLQEQGINVTGTHPLVIAPDNEILRLTLEDKIRRGHTISWTSEK